MIQSQSYTISFIKNTQVAKNTYSFHFQRPEAFDFLAGQYNRWTLPITASDGRGASRFFTISSAPTDEMLTFTTKIIRSDFKKELLKLHPGQEVKIFGPMGQFILDEKNKNEQIFIAGGIGITPFHSMLTNAAFKNSQQSLTLLASFSISEEVVFFNELTKLVNMHPNIKVIYTITKPEESKTIWQGEKGRISDTLIKKYVKDISQSVFRIVGPPSMVENMQKLLEDMQVKNGNIKTEQFSGY